MPMRYERKTKWQRKYRQLHSVCWQSVRHGRLLRVIIEEFETFISVIFLPGIRVVVSVWQQEPRESTSTTPKIESRTRPLRSCCTWLKSLDYSRELMPCSEERGSTLQRTVRPCMLRFARPEAHQLSLTA